MACLVSGMCSLQTASPVADGAVGERREMVSRGTASDDRALVEYYACLREYISYLRVGGVSAAGGDGGVEDTGFDAAGLFSSLWNGPTWLAGRPAGACTGDGVGVEVGGSGTGFGQGSASRRSGVGRLCLEGDFGGPASGQSAVLAGPGGVSSVQQASRLRVDVPVCSAAVRESSQLDVEVTSEAGVGKGPGGEGCADGCVSGVESLSGVVAEAAVVRGKHYVRNRAKRMRARRSEGCPSLTSVKTVDTRTAEEIEASRTYALRRAAENKVAEAQAKFKLASYSDPDRVKAHKRLEAMRYSQRINEANAKSQASYKKCDESLKSLGSSGSAGELALKQQVRQAQEDARMLKYVQAQADYMVRHVSPEVQQYVARMPPPKFESAHELFGDCPEDFDEDERADYYRQLDEVDAASAERFAQWF